MTLLRSRFISFFRPVPGLMSLRQRTMEHLPAVLALLAVVLQLFFAETAQAASGGYDNSVEVEGRWFQGAAGDPPAALDQLPGWLAQLHEVEQVSLQGGSYWFFAPLHVDSDHSQWVLEPGNRLAERIDVRVYSQNALVQGFASGYLQDHDYLLHYGKAISLYKGGNAVVLIRFDSPYYPSTPKVRLYPERAYAHLTLVENVLTLAAFGALCTLALYNLFIFAVIRERTLLYYSAYLLDYFAGWAFTFQLPAQLFGWHDLHLHYVWFFLLPVFGTLFYTEFLELKANFPRLAAIGRGNIALSLMLLPSCFFALPYAHLLATLVISLWILLALISGVASHLQGFRPARYFVAAFTAILVPGMIILPANFGWIPELVRNAELFTLLGGTLDGIMLAFALAYKIRLLSEERSLAQQQVCVQENLNRILESNLQERHERNALLEKMNLQLQQSEALLSESQVIAALGSYVLDVHNGAIECSKVIYRLFGIHEAYEHSLAGWMALVHPADRKKVVQHLQEDVIARGKNFDREYRIIRHDDQTERWMHGLGKVEVDSQGNALRVSGTVQDITERKLAEKQIMEMAFHDTLTGLPNRRLLNDRLEQAIAACNRTGRYGALMFLDLDNFKTLNDVHGHDVGDLLLQESAQRISSCVREMDTVARFGGDEFMVMLCELDAEKDRSAAQAGIVAEKIRRVVDEPYFLRVKSADGVEKTIEHRCTSSIGVVLFLKSEGNATDIIKRADIAMYQAKAAGRNAIRFSTDEIDPVLMEFAALQAV